MPGRWAASRPVGAVVPGPRPSFRSRRHAAAPPSPGGSHSVALVSRALPRAGGRPRTVSAWPSSACAPGWSASSHWSPGRRPRQVWLRSRLAYSLSRRRFHCESGRHGCTPGRGGRGPGGEASTALGAAPGTRAPDGDEGRGWWGRPLHAEPASCWARARVGGCNRWRLPRRQTRNSQAIKHAFRIVREDKLETTRALKKWGAVQKGVTGRAVSARVCG